MTVSKKEELLNNEVNHYKVEKQLSQRATSNLYLAHDTELDRPVFLEIWQQDIQGEPDLSMEFQKRMETVAQLKHENIAAINDLGVTSKNQPYVAIEYVSGKTLAELQAELSERGVLMPATDALLLVRQIADALAAAHAAGIVHHDLRPGNILITEGNRPVLIDLGIPIANKSQLLESSGATPARLDYVSPEQLRGEPLTNRSNIFSLGVILYELLAGHRPQPGVDEDTPPDSEFPAVSVIPLEEARPGLTAETYRLVRNCLQRKERDRFNTVGAMVAAIDVAIAAERAATAARTTPPSRFRLPYVALIALLAVIAIVAGILWLAPRSDGPTQIEATPLDASTVLTLQARGTIEILGPPPDIEISRNDTVVFDWFWPIPLEPDQQFAVHLLSDEGTYLLGVVTTPITGSRYRLRTEGRELAMERGEYQWQIVMEQVTTGDVLFVSDSRPIHLVAATPMPVSSPLMLLATSPVISGTTTLTPTVAATATGTASLTPTLTPSATPDCRPTRPEGWVTYSIKFGDALSPLATKTGTTVERIMEVNCLDRILLSVGQVLYLPASIATDTPVPTPTSTSTVAPTSPPPGQPPPPNPTQPPAPTEPASPPTPTPPLP
ncbi:MAG TPA: protein kinase [Anaerolineae bacterium]